MWHVRWDPPGSARLEVAYLVSHTERHRAAEHDAELFVLVAVLWDDDRWVELDDREADEHPFDRPCKDAVPDPERLQRRELGERGHDESVVLELAYGPGVQVRVPL